MNADAIADFLLSFQERPWAFAALVFASLLVRFILIAGGSYVLLWHLFLRWWPNFMSRRRQQDSRHPTIILYELRYSVLTFIINTILALGLYRLFNEGHTAIYMNFDTRSWGYAFVSLLVCFVVHDAWFYCMHRLMHTRWMYKHIHIVHHRSVNPTPFASFSFHPVEAILEFLFLLPLILWLPLHPATLVLFLLLTHFFVINGHFGFEMLPRRVWTAWWGRWLTTGTHHNLHHRYPKGNYALYCKYWDICLGTYHERTDEEFLLRTASE